MIRRFIVLALLVCFSVNAHSQEPFPCDDSFYQVFGDLGELLSYDLRSNTFVVAPNNAGRPLNAFGYRVEDDFAYGLLQDNANLARLGSDGTIVDLGTITSLPVNMYANAGFSNDGLLYVYSGGHAGDFNRFYAVNVDTVSVVETIDIAGPYFFTSDIAFNPIDGLFYGVSQFHPDAQVPPAMLLAIDVVAGTFEIIGPTNLSEDAVFGSMYADASGRVYGSDRIGLAIFYQFDIETGNATALGETVGVSPIDGFFCQTNPGPFPPRNVPTLSEWGLIAMAGILGIVGFMVMRRRALA